MSNTLQALLSEYEKLVDEQRRLLDEDNYDALIDSLTRADAVRYELEGMRQAGAEELTPELTAVAARIRGKVAEQQRQLKERMRALGAENAKRTETRRGIAGYNPLPPEEAENYDRKA